MKLAWKASTLATAAYVGRALSQGKRSDLIGLSPELVGVAEEFQSVLRLSQLPAVRFWDELLAWSGAVERRQAVERAIMRTADVPSAPADLTLEFDQRFEGIEQELKLLRPKLEEELSHRARPIREAWGTIGPGLLRTLEGLTEPGLLPTDATVVVVHPFAGGGGVAHLTTGSATWEGMLAHPHPDLPETLRLAWLLSQLGVDRLRDRAGSNDHGERIAALAMLPATLAAGEEFDLCRCDEPTLTRAMKLWGVAETHEDRAAEALLAWWGACRERRPPWETALVGLEQNMPVA